MVNAMGKESLPSLVQLMCHNPATLYRIDRRGFIREGYHADLALVDMNASHVISNKDECSKCGWTPYDGIQSPCRVTHTLVNGNLVFENGIFHEETRGERLLFDY
jgi:dihydroorotase